MFGEARGILRTDRDELRRNSSPSSPAAPTPETRQPPGRRTGLSGNSPGGATRRPASARSPRDPRRSISIPDVAIFSRTLSESERLSGNLSTLNRAVSLAMARRDKSVRQFAARFFAWTKLSSRGSPWSAHPRPPVPLRDRVVEQPPCDRETLPSRPPTSPTPAPASGRGAPRRVVAACPVNPLLSRPRPARTPTPRGATRRRVQTCSRVTVKP